MSKETQVAVATQFTVNDVPALLAQAQQKLATLKGPDKGNFRELTLSFPGFGNIQEINCEQTLIKAMTSVDGKEAAYKATWKKRFSKLGGKMPEFTLSGEPAKLWRDNIIARYNAFRSAEEIEKVEQAIALLEENLSKEAKFNTSMQKIADIFS